MKPLYKYILALATIALVVAVILYQKNDFTNNKKSYYSHIERADSSNTNDENNSVAPTATLTSSDSSNSLQSVETPSIIPDVEKSEITSIPNEEINQVEKNDADLTEEELERKKWALVKKYSSQLPTIYDIGKTGGPNVVGSSLEYMKQKADEGYNAAKFNYAAELQRRLWKGRFEIKPEEVEQSKMRFKEPHDYMRSAAVDGNAWAAICLGCDYFLPPFEDELEGLTWVLIGAKLGWTWACGKYTPIDEKLYVQALEQAKFYLDYYDFKTEKGNDM
jgi:hypothetical protein